MSDQIKDAIDDCTKKLEGMDKMIPPPPSDLEKVKTLFNVEMQKVLETVSKIKFPEPFLDENKGMWDVVAIVTGASGFTALGFAIAAMIK